MDETGKNKDISFTYTDHQGKTSVRRLQHIDTYWGKLEHFPEGLVFKAVDVEKGETIELALKNCDFTSGETAFRAGFEAGEDYQSEMERGSPSRAKNADAAWANYKS